MLNVELKVMVYSGFIGLEQVGMRAGIDEYQAKLSVVLLPHEQPVWVDVTFPAAFVFALQLMLAIFGREYAFLLQNIEHGHKLLNVESATGATFQRPLKLSGVDYFVHRLAKNLLNEVFCILGVIDIAFADVLKSFFYPTLATTAHGPPHFLRQTSEQTQVSVWQRKTYIFYRYGLHIDVY